MSLLLGYGCAAKKLAINNADTLITYQITRHIPQDTAQKKELTQNVVSFLNESKPLAKDLLKVLKQIDLKDPKNIGTHYARLEKDYIKLATDFSSILAPALAGLGQDQQKDFFKQLKKENDKIKKGQKDRDERIADRFKHFFGSLNHPQELLLKEYKSYFIERSELRLQRRVKLQQSFEEIYLEQALVKREKLFLAVFVDYQKDGPKGNKNLEMIQALIPTLSEEQHKFFNSKKDEIAELLQYFIERSY
ncbi:MAG: hypothetical protein NDI69_00140 [Bacteriovoracaceae bacterium]|nr:hypothetical protein [Bacteriovoracaceae bacterium]